MIDYDTQVNDLEARLERYYKDIVLTEARLVAEMKVLKHGNQLIFTEDEYELSRRDYVDLLVVGFTGCKWYDHELLDYTFGDWGLSPDMHKYLHAYVDHNPLWHYAKFTERLILETRDQLAELKAEDQKHTRLISKINSSTKVDYEHG